MPKMRRQWIRSDGTPTLECLLPPSDLIHPTVCSVAINTITSVLLDYTGNLSNRLESLDSSPGPSPASSPGTSPSSWLPPETSSIHLRYGLPPEHQAARKLQSLVRDGIAWHWILYECQEELLDLHQR